MAFGMNNTATLSLLSSTFGVQFGGLYSGAGGALASASLANIQKAQLSAYQAAIDNRQAFNRTELNLRTAAVKLGTASTTQINTTSSNPNAVSATALSNAVPGNYSVQVNQLAASQKVQGANLTAATPSAIATTAGYGQLDFNIGGVSRLVTYQLNGTETNQQALGKIAAAVNARGIGVTATVTTDTSGNARLNLEGATGAANAFTVSDSLGNGAAVTGIAAAGNIVQNAQNAKFTVNGVAFDTATNAPTLNATGIALNLQQTTGAPATISVQANTSTTESAVRGFVSQFNDTLTKLQSNSNYYAQGSATTLRGIAQQNSGALANIGVTVGSNGALSIDESVFAGALANKPGDVASVFGGSSRFVSAVQSETERAINQSLASPVSGGFTKFSSQQNTYGIGLNSLISSNIGLFFNSVF